MPTSASSFTLSEQLSSAERDIITECLRAFNLAHEGIAWRAPEKVRPVHVSARDAAGMFVGGLVRETHAIPYWPNVSELWVAEAVRGQGIGSSLLKSAEDIAKHRGCTYARLATSHYQAPDFYARQGYREYGRLENCPLGETVLYFCKILS